MQMNVNVVEMLKTREQELQSELESVRQATRILSRLDEGADGEKRVYDGWTRKVVGKAELLPITREMYHKLSNPRPRSASHRSKLSLAMKRRWAKWHKQHGEKEK
jgi:hypothetical protein